MTVIKMRSSRFSNCGRIPRRFRADRERDKKGRSQERERTMSVLLPEEEMQDQRSPCRRPEPGVKENACCDYWHEARRTSRRWEGGPEDHVSAAPRTRERK